MVMPTAFAGEVQIKTIRKVGNVFGGIIFTARTTCKQHRRFVVRADHRIARSARLFRENHTWYVEGDVAVKEVQWNDGTRHKEWQIEATALQFKKASNENLTALLTNVAGVGYAKASKIVNALGDELYEIARNDDKARLKPLCGEDVAARIFNELNEYEALAAIQLLDELGVPKHIADHALNIWGKEAYKNIATNPYFLTAFEPSMKLVDAFALERLDFKETALARLEAYAKSVLFKAFDRGHTCLTEQEWRWRLQEVLDSKKLVDMAIEYAYQNGSAVKIGGLVQVGSMHIIETTVVENINTLLKRKFDLADTTSINRAIDAYEQNVGFSLTVEQRQAVGDCCNSGFTVLTGGAGCGKTTVLQAICYALEESGQTSEIRMMALAGKAAQRITEATGREAMTIASFLYHVDEADIAEDATIIIDEASMVDILSFNQLLRRVPTRGRLILTGDPEQLPPVGVGLTLHKLVELDVPHPHLSVVKRQKASSGIPAVADGIRNYHTVPKPIVFAQYQGVGNGVSFIDIDNANLAATVLNVYAQLGGDGSSNEVLILSAMRSGAAGVDSLNGLIHNEYINNPTAQIVFQHKEFDQVNREINQNILCIGELVMYKRNDYKKDIRNGSLGKVLAFDEDRQTVLVDFEGNKVDLNYDELSNLDLAYALTVHKSQGSQFKRVIVVVKDCRILDRHLLYTAVTRATEQVVVIGCKRTFYSKLGVSKALQRNTLLTEYFEMAATVNG